MDRKYEAKFTCGACGKVSIMSDKQVEKTLSEDSFKGICSCGGFWYGSKMTAKFKPSGSWKWCYGSGSTTERKV